MKMKAENWLGFGMILCLLQTIADVDGKGYIQTNFIEFENFEGRRFDGKCCDKSGWWSSGSECSNECDHSFVICMGNGTQSSSMSACEFGKKKTDIVGGNKIRFNGNLGNYDNPVKFPFTSWPGVVKLKIDVQDDDDDEYDLVDHYEYQYNTRELRRELDAPVKDLVLTGTRSRFNMELKVFCETGHYGPDCGTFCQPTDDHTGHYRCDPATGDKVCILGWTGDDCLTNVDDCNGARCSFGSTCVDGVNTYTCLCPPGRTGFSCEAEINECASSPCRNGGKCYDESNNFRCDCPKGFVGPRCEIELNECMNAPCLNGGVCSDGVGTFTCTCQPGFTGNRCEADIDECVRYAPCVQAETCVNLPGSYKCNCFPGFTGKNCEGSINECESGPCINEGYCIDKINNYSCICAYGFTGYNCEQKVNFCDGINCFNGGTCFNSDTGFICKCDPSFFGTWCEMDLDECDENPNQCGDHGNCANVYGNYYCDCNEGYSGRHCDTEIDECTEVDEPCLNGGTCVDMIGTFKCACPIGFTGPVCATNIDECASSPCMNFGDCIDLINEYICSCPLGYTGLRCEEHTTTSILPSTYSTISSSLDKVSTSFTNLRPETTSITDLTEEPDITSSKMFTSTSSDISDDTTNEIPDITMIPFSMNTFPPTTSVSTSISHESETTTIINLIDQIIQSEEKEQSTSAIIQEETISSEFLSASGDIIESSDEFKASSGDFSGYHESSGDTRKFIESSGDTSGFLESSEVSSGYTASGDTSRFIESSGYTTGHIEISSDASEYIVSSGDPSGYIESSGDTSGYLFSSGISSGYIAFIDHSDLIESSGYISELIESSGDTSGFIELSGDTQGLSDYSGDTSGFVESSGDTSGLKASSGDTSNLIASSGDTSELIESSGDAQGFIASSGDMSGFIVSSGDTSGYKSSSGDTSGFIESSGDNQGLTDSSGETSGFIESSSDTSGFIESSGDTSGFIASSSVTSDLIASSGDTSGLIETSGDTLEFTESSGDTSGIIEPSSDTSGFIESSGDTLGFKASSGDTSDLIASSGDTSELIESSGDAQGFIASSGDMSGFIVSSGDTSGYKSSSGDTSGFIESSGDTSGVITSSGETSGFIESSGDTSGFIASSGDTSGFIESSYDTSGFIESSGNTLTSGDFSEYTGTSGDTSGYIDLSGDAIEYIASGETSGLIVSSGDLLSDASRGYSGLGDQSSGAIGFIESSGDIDSSGETSEYTESGDTSGYVASGDTLVYITSGDTTEHIASGDTTEYISSGDTSGHKTLGDTSIYVESSGDTSRYRDISEDIKGLKESSGDALGYIVSSGGISEFIEPSGDTSGYIESSGFTSGYKEILVDSSGYFETVDTSGYIEASVDTSRDNIQSSIDELDKVYHSSGKSTATSSGWIENLWQESFGQVSGDSKNEYIDYKEYKIISSGEESGEVSPSDPYQNDITKGDISDLEEQHSLSGDWSGEGIDSGSSSSEGIEELSSLFSTYEYEISTFPSTTGSENLSHVSEVYGSSEAGHSGDLVDWKESSGQFSGDDGAESIFYNEYEPISSGDDIIKEGSGELKGSGNISSLGQYSTGKEINDSIDPFPVTTLINITETNVLNEASSTLTSKDPYYITERNKTREKQKTSNVTYSKTVLPDLTVTPFIQQNITGEFDKMTESGNGTIGKLLDDITTQKSNIHKDNNTTEDFISSVETTTVPTITRPTHINVTLSTATIQDEEEIKTGKILTDSKQYVTTMFDSGSKASEDGMKPTTSLITGNNASTDSSLVAIKAEQHVTNKNVAKHTRLSPQNPWFKAYARLKNQKTRKNKQKLKSQVTTTSTFKYDHTDLTSMKTNALSPTTAFYTSIFQTQKSQKYFTSETRFVQDTNVTNISETFDSTQQETSIPLNQNTVIPILNKTLPFDHERESSEKQELMTNVSEVEDGKEISTDIVTDGISKEYLTTIKHSINNYTQFISNDSTQMTTVKQTSGQYSDMMITKHLNDSHTNTSSQQLVSEMTTQYSTKGYDVLKRKKNTTLETNENVFRSTDSTIDRTSISHSSSTKGALSSYSSLNTMRNDDITQTEKETSTFSSTTNALDKDIIEETTIDCAFTTCSIPTPPPPLPPHLKTNFTILMDETSTTSAQTPTETSTLNDPTQRANVSIGSSQVSTQSLSTEYGSLKTTEASINLTTDETVSESITFDGDNITDTYGIYTKTPIMTSTEQLKSSAGMALNKYDTSTTSHVNITTEQFTEPDRKTTMESISSTYLSGKITQILSTRSTDLHSTEAREVLKLILNKGKEYSPSAFPKSTDSGIGDDKYSVINVKKEQRSDTTKQGDFITTANSTYSYLKTHAMENTFSEASTMTEFESTKLKDVTLQNIITTNVKDSSVSSTTERTKQYQTDEKTVHTVTYPIFEAKDKFSQNQTPYSINVSISRMDNTKQNIIDQVSKTSTVDPYLESSNKSAKTISDDSKTFDLSTITSSTFSKRDILDTGTEIPTKKSEGIVTQAFDDFLTTEEGTTKQLELTTEPIEKKITMTDKKKNTTLFKASDNSINSLTSNPILSSTYTYKDPMFELTTKDNNINQTDTLSEDVTTHSIHHITLIQIEEKVHQESISGLDRVFEGFKEAQTTEETADKTIEKIETKVPESTPLSKIDLETTTRNLKSKESLQVLETTTLSTDKSSLTSLSSSGIISDNLVIPTKIVPNQTTVKDRESLKITEKRKNIGQESSPDLDSSIGFTSSISSESSTTFEQSTKLQTGSPLMDKRSSKEQTHTIYTTTSPASKTTSPTVKPRYSIGSILIKVSKATSKPSNTSEAPTTMYTYNETDMFTTTTLLTPITHKLSKIRLTLDLTSNNTYPHPRKEIYEYDRNTTLAKGTAKLTFHRIKVVVIRKVTDAYRTGKKVVLKTFQKVKNITTSITVTTYNRARELLQTALNRVEALWQYCTTGINHFIVKPLLDASVVIKERFTNAYARLGEVFKRGKLIFETTADDVRKETQTYYESLANYYTGVYRQYSEEVRNIFESLKIPE